MELELGDLQLDSYSETAASPVLLHVCKPVVSKVRPLVRLEMRRACGGSLISRHTNPLQIPRPLGAHVAAAPPGRTGAPMSRHLNQPHSPPPLHTSGARCRALLVAARRLLTPPRAPFMYLQEEWKKEREREREREREGKDGEADGSGAAQAGADDGPPPVEPAFKCSMIQVRLI